MKNAGRPNAITSSHLIEFIELCNSGIKQQAAANAIGFSLGGIRLALKKHKLKVPRTLLVDKIKERINEIKTSDKPQSWWAKEFGVTQAAICKAFSELQISSYVFNGHQPGPKVLFKQRVDEYKQILDHLQTNGGYIPHSIEALGLKTPPQPVRDFARDIGINVSEYQFAWREYGLWLTLPGSWKKIPPSNYIVPAICQGCGLITELNLCNARNERTQGCMTCSAARKNSYKVRDCQTEVIYPSIMSWAKATNNKSGYQKYRLHFKKHRILNIGDNIYELIIN